MSDEIIGAGGEVIVIDFRRSGSMQTAVIGMNNGSSLSALASQLIAKAFNVKRASDIAMVVTDDGKADDCIAPMSNHDAARMLSRITKRPVVYVDVPENIARQSMRHLGMPASLVEALLRDDRRSDHSRST
ncbi:MAG TPA: hypothetical protein VER58_11355 [Thermoanaerobaculia bacterium]|nr:hypothetical protein [Thermoanaerobaculia bacterium]